MGGSLASKPVVADQYYAPTVEQWQQAQVAKGKTIAITGSTTGLGFELAVTSCRLGAKKVVLLNRASSRADDAKAKVEVVAKETQTTVVSIPCDLTSFESVKQACVALAAECGAEGLDVLACNAGVMAMPETATVDGYDIQSQVNHLSHFLLIKNTWPLLEAAAAQRGEARVVNHASSARNGPPVALQSKYFEKMGEPGCLGGTGASPSGANWVRYHETKLANVVFTFALHDHAAAVNSKVKAVVAEPGIAATELLPTTAQAGGAGTMLQRIVRWYMQSQKDGSLPLTHCCWQPDLASGSFAVPEKKSMLMGFHYAGVPTLLAEGGIFKGSLATSSEKLSADLPSRNSLWEWSEAATGPFKL